MGRITYIDEDFFCYDAPTFPGTTGIPVLDLSTNNKFEFEFIGIHSKGSAYFRESCAIRRLVIERAVTEKELWYLPILWDLSIILIARYFFRVSSKEGRYGVVIFFSFFMYLFGCFIPDLLGL